MCLSMVQALPITWASNGQRVEKPLEESSGNRKQKLCPLHLACRQERARERKSAVASLPVPHSLGAKYHPGRKGDVRNGGQNATSHPEAPFSTEAHRLKESPLGSLGILQPR